jgi:hypothetical protein
VVHGGILVGARGGGRGDDRDGARFANRSSTGATVEVLARQSSGRIIRVPWPDVDSFILASASPFNSGVSIAVRLKNGRLLMIQGLVASSRRATSAERTVP